MEKGNQKVMLGGPVDTIVMAPSLVGFTPKNSLVIFSVDENDYVDYYSRKNVEAVKACQHEEGRAIDA